MPVEGVGLDARYPPEATRRCPRARAGRVGGPDRRGWRANNRPWRNPMASDAVGTSVIRRRKTALDGERRTAAGRRLVASETRESPATLATGA